MKGMSITPLTTQEILALSAESQARGASGVGSRGRAINEYAVDGYLAIATASPCMRGGPMVAAWLRRGGTASSLVSQCLGVGSVTYFDGCILVGWLRGTPVAHRPEMGPRKLLRKAEGWFVTAGVWNHMHDVPHTQLILVAAQRPPVSRLLGACLQSSSVACDPSRFRRTFRGGAVWENRSLETHVYMRGCASERIGRMAINRPKK